MIKQTVTYRDYFEVEHTEDFYFNLNIDEVMELQTSLGGGDLESLLKMMVDKKDIAGLIGSFKKIMELAYGVRSEDGKRFVKTPEAWQEFASSNAFNTLFWELLTDAKKAGDFVLGMLPGDFDEKVARLKALQEVNQQDLLAASSAYKEAAIEEVQHEPYKRTVDDYSRDELLNMDQELFNKLVGTDPHKMHKEHLVIAMQRRTLGKND